MSYATYDGAWEVVNSIKSTDPLEGEKLCPVCKKGMVKYKIQNPDGLFRGHWSAYCSSKNCISFVK